MADSIFKDYARMYLQSLIEQKMKKASRDAQRRAEYQDIFSQGYNPDIASEMAKTFVQGGSSPELQAFPQKQQALRMLQQAQQYAAANPEEAAQILREIQAPLQRKEIIGMSRFIPMPAYSPISGKTLPTLNLPTQLRREKIAGIPQYVPMPTLPPANLPFSYKTLPEEPGAEGAALNLPTQLLPGETLPGEHGMAEAVLNLPPQQVWEGSPTLNKVWERLQGMMSEEQKAKLAGTRALTQRRITMGQGTDTYEDYVNTMGKYNINMNSVAKEFGYGKERIWAGSGPVLKKDVMDIIKRQTDAYNTPIFWEQIHNELGNAYNNALEGFYGRDSAKVLGLFKKYGGNWETMSDVNKQSLFESLIKGGFITLESY